MVRKTRKLTPRQLAVLKLTIWTNREISIRLKISEQTVKNHWSDIFRAMGVQSRCEAMLMALDTGLLTLEDFRIGVKPGDVCEACGGTGKCAVCGGTGVCEETTVAAVDRYRSPSTTSEL